MKTGPEDATFDIRPTAMIVCETIAMGRVRRIHREVGEKMQEGECPFFSTFPLPSTWIAWWGLRILSIVDNFSS